MGVLPVCNFSQFRQLAAKAGQKIAPHVAKGARIAADEIGHVAKRMFRGMFENEIVGNEIGAVGDIWGLEKATQGLEGSLRNPDLNENTRQLLEQKLRTAQETLQRMKDALGQ